jgi:hypothetical protein
MHIVIMHNDCMNLHVCTIQVVKIGLVADVEDNCTCCCSKICK